MDRKQNNFLYFRKTSSIFVLCRAFRDMIRNLRERSLKTLSLIRLLCSELEICARYDWKSSKENEMCDEEEKKKCCDTLVEQLLKTGHIVVIFLSIYLQDLFMLEFLTYLMQITYTLGKDKIYNIHIFVKLLEIKIIIKCDV